MSGVININNLNEFYRFLNDKGVIEIVQREANKRIRAIQKVAINSLQNEEANQLVKEVFQAINKNNQLLDKQFALLQSVEGMQNITLILNGLNLAATCAGFAILYAKLDKISKEITHQIHHLHQTVKQGHDVQNGYEFDKVLANYSDMLDSRRLQRPYSEEKMRELIDQLYNVLNLLINVFKRNIATDNQSIIFYIFSLLSMLTMSLRFYDEQYYYNNREVLKNNNDIWHTSHVKWMSAYDTLNSDWFLEKLQDYVFFETNLTTLEMDVYCTELLDQVSSQKEEVEDNQKLIIALDDQSLYHTVNELNTAEIKENIVSKLKETLNDESDASTQAYQAIMYQVNLL